MPFPAGPGRPVSRRFTAAARCAVLAVKAANSGDAGKCHIAVSSDGVRPRRASAPDPPGGGDDDLSRSAARRDARAAGLGKPHELRARDGARIVVGEGARNEARCDRVVDAWRQDVKGGAPVDQSATLMCLLEIPTKANL